MLDHCGRALLVMKPISCIFLRMVVFCLIGVSGFKLGYGQYGLGFAGQEVMQDRRTGLHLNQGNAICFNGDFELSFDISFFPNQLDYFGYIVRIIDDEGHNLDLLYDRRLSIDKQFRVVYGDNFSAISFSIPQDSLFENWTAIRIKFDVTHNKLSVFKNSEQFSEQIPLKKGRCYTVLFGLNDHERFSTIDVPAMKLRNVRFADGGKQRAFWLLDEVDGTTIRDQHGDFLADVINPLWQKKRHLEWENAQEFTFKGYVNVAFDPKEEQLYLIGDDSLIVYSIGNHRVTNLPYLSGRLNLGMDNQAIFDTLNNRLLEVSIDEQTISQFDSDSRRWSESFIDSVDDTNYWHANKFYFPGNNSLYTLGGYGHFQFRNDIWQYQTDSKQWELISNSSGFAPRYLAALGVAQNGAYIIGGYGSNSGQQMLNPRNYYDLWFFNPKDGTIGKLHEFATPEENFVFANSLVVDEGKHLFYGLIFPKNEFNSHLQLVRGNLKNFSMIPVGGEVPYQFHDVHSFADLFFAPTSNRFVAVTLFSDAAGLTTSRVYTLYSPPLPMADGKNRSPNRFNVWLYVGLSSSFLTILFVGYSIRRRRLLQTANQERKSVAIPLSEVPSSLDPDRVPDRPPDEEKRKSSIFLFGNMQLFDKEGNDITRLLTPLIRELFLAILLHTTKRDGGISSEKLFELLWFDKSVENARNNRSVSIARLKTILGKIGECKISKKTGYWRVEIKDPQIYVDYWDYLALVRNKDTLDKSKIAKLSQIVQRGSFLNQCEYEWLDPFKSEVSNEIIDAYLHIADVMQIQEDPEFIIQIANNIFFFDPVNEEAMIMKCNALSYLGKHSLAMQAFETFRKEYLHIYGEEFKKEFRQIIQ